MRNTEHLLRIKKNYPQIWEILSSFWEYRTITHRYEKYWVPFENIEQNTQRYEKYWALTLSVLDESYSRLVSCVLN
jgi:hypothetical protein